MLPQTSIEHAYIADSLERDLNPLPLSDPHTFEMEVKPHAIITIRILNRITIPPACGRFCGMSSSTNNGDAASAP